MQFLNISSFTDNRLETLADKIPEMKHVSIFSVNSTLTKLRTYPNNFWSPLKVKIFSTISTPVAVISITFFSIGLYCKYFKMDRVVYINTLDQHPYQSVIPTLN